MRRTIHAVLFVALWALGCAAPVPAAQPGASSAEPPAILAQSIERNAPPGGIGAEFKELVEAIKSLGSSLEKCRAITVSHEVRVDSSVMFCVVAIVIGFVLVALILMVGIGAVLVPRRSP